VHLGLPPVAVMLGAMISGVLAYLVGRPILRLKGYYLGVATLGFGILFRWCSTTNAELTRGPDGIEVADSGLARRAARQLA
jgi:branched-chain amino acid transport system permease protein